MPSIKSEDFKVHFLTKASFRSDLVNLLSIYQTFDRIGVVDRVGIANF